MPPGALSPKATDYHQDHTYYDSDTETLVDPDGSPYYKAMKHNTVEMTTDRSPSMRQTRSTTTSSSDTNNQHKTSFSSKPTKRKAAAAALASINTSNTTMSRKRKRPIGDEIEVRSARSRESSVATSISTLTSRRSSDSMPPPSSITPPFNSPLVSSKSSSNINRRNQAGETKLHRAAAAGKLEEVQDLLQRGAQVNVQCNAGWTPLHKACLKGYDQIVRILCQNGARTDIVSNDEHDTPLHDACSNGHEEVVRILLEFGANPGVHNSEGFFPHEKLDDDLEELKQLLKDKAKELKETTTKKEHDEREDSEPPISPAMKRHSRRASTASDVPIPPPNPGNGRPKRGAPFAKDDFLARDIHYMDSHRRGHLHLQALQGNTAFVRELLFMGARPLAGDRDGNHPIHLAARGGHHDVVVALLEYGALVNAQNKAGETPLHEVAGRGHIDIVNTLLIVEADPTIKDKKGRTALDVALEASETAAEGEIDMLREKFTEILGKKGILPEDKQKPSIKMEDSDDPIPAVSEEVEVEMENHANGTSSLSPQLSPKLDNTILPIDNAVEETPEPVITVKSFSREPTEKVRTPPHIEPEVEEEQSEEMQIDLPEASPLSAPSPSPVPLVADEIEVLEEIVLPAPEIPTPIIETETVEEIPLETAETAPEAAIEETLAEESIAEGEVEEEIPPPATEDDIEEVPVVGIEETMAEEIVPSEPTIQPLWELLMSLGSIPLCAKKEISMFLPLCTMRFLDEMMQEGTYIAHIQLCGLLGFKTHELFERYPNLSKRALSNREKSRFLNIFVSQITHPINLLPLSESQNFLKDELQPTTSLRRDELWEQFAEQRKRQFMAMSVYLIPLEQVKQLVASDFSVLFDLVVKRESTRLDTSDLQGEDEGIVYCDEEADRYVDCWRRVADKYVFCGL